jgi:hypothetical protein
MIVMDTPVQFPKINIVVFKTIFDEVIMKKMEVIINKLIKFLAVGTIAFFVVSCVWAVESDQSSPAQSGSTASPAQIDIVSSPIASVPTTFPIISSPIASVPAIFPMGEIEAALYQGLGAKWPWPGKAIHNALSLTPVQIILDIQNFCFVDSTGKKYIVESPYSHFSDDKREDLLQNDAFTEELPRCMCLQRENTIMFSFDHIKGFNFSAEALELFAACCNVYSQKGATVEEIEESLRGLIDGRVQDLLAESFSAEVFTEYGKHFEDVMAGVKELGRLFGLREIVNFFEV